MAKRNTQASPEELAQREIAAAEKRKKIIEKHYKPQDFKVKKGEEKVVHCEIVKHVLNMETEEPKYKPFIQTFTAAEWKVFLENPSGFDIVKIHHLPEGALTVEQFEKLQAEKRKKYNHFN